MGAVAFRSFLFAICLLTGALAGPGFSSNEQAPVIGGVVGFVVFLLVISIEGYARRARPYVVLGSGLGALAGILGTHWARQAFALDQLPLSITVGVGGLLIYLGVLVGTKGIRALGVTTSKPGMSSSATPKILDTSAVIDGRIADMVDLGFIGGPFVVPQFVLNELQGIADSSDPLKRARGRRGLGILERLQGTEGLEMRITDQDLPKVKTVDAKIVAVAKAAGYTVVTNDYNLTKVAELQGVRVLNVHQLAHALRPVVLPGEVVQVTVQKEGKEPGQGVGYLEDGTMVVVEEGVAQMGLTVKTVVTSVLQTSAGRLIFTRLEGAAAAVPREKRRVWSRRG